MAITKNDAAKRQIIRVLNRQGYPTYARLLNLFDIYLTDNPEHVGFMIPNKGVIVLNKKLDVDQVSTIVRHELLHEWLNHGPRGLAFEKAKEIEPNSFTHELSNIAADYEISNRGYTERDKLIARNIKLGDKVLQGLVTEDKYPGWTRMTFEEMYDELLKRTEEDRKQLEELLKMLSQLNPQDLDELEKQIQQEMDNQESREGSSQMDELQKEIQDVKDQLGGIEKDQKNPLPTKEEQDAKEELAKKVEQIKKTFEDSNELEKALQDAQTQKQLEKQRKIKRAEDRMRKDPLHKFKINLNNFIAQQLEEIEEEAYTKLNPSYEDSEFIIPGIKDVENKYVPVINVYHDTSGSFTSHPEKQRAVDSAIAVLQEYERRGDIKINRYYHADRVAPTRAEAGEGNDGDNVIRHIQATKPDNVIITTDRDLDDTELSATVPGAVWMLFFEGESGGLIKNLKGRKQTKIYDIYH